MKIIPSIENRKGRLMVSFIEQLKPFSKIRNHKLQ